MNQKTFIYISDTSRGILIYKMNPTNGDLDLVTKIDVGGQPGSLTVDPAHTHLYAAIRSTKSVSSFSINSRNGDVTLLRTIQAGMNPVYVKTDRTGKFLFIADNNINLAAVFTIGKDGAVQEGAVQTITTADFPHSLQAAPSNRYVYVLCRSGEKIQRFPFDPAEGKLSLSSREVVTPDSTGPRHLEFHPALNVVYVVNEFGRSVTAYRIDTTDGTLSAFQTMSMVPPHVEKPITPNKGGADIHLTPDHRFLYATNRDPDELVAFSVDPSSGMLTPVAQYPTEKTPRAFEIDPTGNFLYVGGQTSGNLAAYRVDSSDGHLTHIRTYHIGSSLVWVLIVQVHDE